MPRNTQSEQVQLSLPLVEAYTDKLSLLLHVLMVTVFGPTFKFASAFKAVRASKTGRKTRKGTDIKPSGTAKFMKVDGVTQWYVESMCKFADHAAQSIIDAVAKCKHKIGAGANGGAVPAAITADVARQFASVLLQFYPQDTTLTPQEQHDRAIKALESDAQFLIDAAPKSDRDNSRLVQVSIPGVATGQFRVSGSKSEKAVENWAALTTILGMIPNVEISFPNDPNPEVEAARETAATNMAAEQAA